MRIGATEIIVVLIVALLVIGPDKLPVYAKKFGEAMAAFKKATSDATKDIQESVVEPLNEAQKPLKEAIEPIENTRKEIRSQVEGVQKSLNNIGKTSSRPTAQSKSAVADEKAAPSGTTVQGQTEITEKPESSEMIKAEESPAEAAAPEPGAEPASETSGVVNSEAADLKPADISGEAIRSEESEIAQEIPDTSELSVQKASEDINKDAITEEVVPA